MAEVARVLVSEGDDVGRDDPLLELEADKASYELPSPISGRVTAVMVEPGEEVSVGQAVLSISDSDSDGTEDADSDSSRDPTEDANSESDADPESESDPDPESESESDSGARGGAGEQPEAEVPCESVGPTSRRGADIDVASEVELASKGSDGSTPVRASPATRKLARRLGVALADVAAEEGERVTREAVERHVREARGGEGPERRPLTGVRRATASRMSRSWRTIPQVTQHELADVGALLEARTRYEAHRGDDEPRLGLHVLVAHAVVRALGGHPRFNARFDEDDAAVLLHPHVHLAQAVDTENGLVAPVLRNAETRSLGELAEDLDELARRARAGRLGRDDLEGATFTISNVGAIGGSFFTPIIVPPQVAILGVARAREGVYGPGGPHLPMSLTYDHRAVDGADAVRFLRSIASRLADPLRFAT